MHERLVGSSIAKLLQERLPLCAALSDLKKKSVSDSLLKVKQLIGTYDAGWGKLLATKFSLKLLNIAVAVLLFAWERMIFFYTMRPSFFQGFPA